MREIDFSAGPGDLSRVRFQDCMFGVLGLDVDLEPNQLPHFSRCYIAFLEGRVSYQDLPADVFEDTEIETFSVDAATTNSILELQIPLGVRVLITVLKKLFERRGRGRRENALYRGLDNRARQLVPGVLQLLRSEGLAYPIRMGTQTVWIPDRSAKSRAGRIIASPSAKSDPLVTNAASLS